MNFVENHRDIIWVWIRIWRRFEPNLWRTEEEEVEGKENVHVCVCVCVLAKTWKSMMQNFCNLEHRKYMKRDKPAD
jgi:hypothetical protein